MNVLPDGVHRNQAFDRGFVAIGAARNGSAGQDERWTVPALVNVARRRSRLILALFASCVLAAGAYAVTSPPLYTSAAVLLTDTRQAPPSAGQVSNESLIDPAVIESQVETLKSDKIALDVVDKLKLDEDSEFVGSGPDWKARLSAAVLRTPVLTPSRETKRQAALDTLKRKLKVSRTGHSYLAEIAAVTSAPDKSALIANAVAEAYIHDQLDGGLQAAQRSSAWMKQRVDEVQQQSAASKAALDSFDAAHGAGRGGDNDTARRADLAEAQAQVKRAQQTRAFFEDRIEKAGKLSLSSAAPDLTPTRIVALAALGDAELTSLTDQWKATQTPLGSRARSGGQSGAQADRSAVENAINVRLGKLLDDARKQVVVADESLSAASARVQDLSELAGSEAALRQQRTALESAAQADQTQYETLFNRYTRVSQFLQQQSLPVTQARILSYAAPPLSKSAPRTSVILLLGTLGGLVLGAGAALIRETFDHHIRWPDQVKRDLGLPLIGVLPVAAKSAWRSSRLRDVSAESRLETAFRGRATRASLPLLFDAQKPWCAATEVVRRLKIAVDQMVRRGPGTVVGIVSALDGEGKTTLTYNFARLVAETGRRVLVIDGDLRKPDLSRAVAPHNTAGLAAALAEDVQIEACVEPTEFGFDILADTAATKVLHSFEIIGSDEMQRAITAAQSVYDYILIDLPPLLYSVDAQVAGRFVDAYVLVVEFGRTTTDAVEQGLAGSGVMSDRLLGAVLNKSRAVQGRMSGGHGARSIRQVA